MNAATRLALFGAGLLLAFGAAHGLAGLIVPQSFVTAWMEQGGAGAEHGSGVDAGNDADQGADDRADDGQEHEKGGHDE